MTASPTADPLLTSHNSVHQMSYFHASWERQEDIERVDPQAKMKLKRFMQTPQPHGILGTKVCKEFTHI